MGARLIHYDRMASVVMKRQTVNTVKVSNAAHRSGKPMKWLTRNAQAEGEYAFHQKHTRGVPSGIGQNYMGVIWWFDYYFTDPNTAFVFALHFGGQGHAK